MGNYRELEVWQKARALASHVYRITARFPRREWFGITQQMRRAGVSIPSNIAEAHGRWTSRDRMRFLRISRGSLFELETQVFIAGDLEFLSEQQTENAVEKINEVTRLLNGLIRHYARKLRGT